MILIRDIKKYRANKGVAKIEEIYIDKETISTVWIKGDKFRKITDEHVIFDTKEEVCNKLKAWVKRDIQLKQKELNEACIFLEEVLKLN